MYDIRTPEQRNNGQNHEAISLQEVKDMFQEEADEAGVGEIRKIYLERQGWGNKGSLNGETSDEMLNIYIYERKTFCLSVYPFEFDKQEFCKWLDQRGMIKKWR